MFETAEPDQREFVAGEVACVLHLAPTRGEARLGTALDVMAQPRRVAALEPGRIGVGHALAVLGQVGELDPEDVTAVLDEVLGSHDAEASDDEDAPELDLTPGELRAACQRAAVLVDPASARRRHERARRRAGVRGGQVTTVRDD